MNYVQKKNLLSIIIIMHALQKEAGMYSGKGE